MIRIAEVGRVLKLGSIEGEKADKQTHGEADPKRIATPPAALDRRCPSEARAIGPAIRDVASGRVLDSGQAPVSDDPSSRTDQGHHAWCGGALIASMTYFPVFEGRYSAHELLIALFLLLTAPVSANMIAKVTSMRRVPAGL